MGASFLKEPKTEKSVEDGENQEVRYGLASMQGWRTEMEDAHTVVLSGDSDGVSFFGVFDGHSGDMVSEYCSLCWVDHVKQSESYPGDLSTAMSESFFTMDEFLRDSCRSSEFFKKLETQKKMDERKRAKVQDPRDIHQKVRALMQDANNQGSLSTSETYALAESMCELEQEAINRRAHVCGGSTAICATLRGSKLVVANAGDSRGVLCRENGRVFPLSHDHKPEHKVETDRILRAGGYVKDGRVNGQLALSRAIGDFEFKQNVTMTAQDQAVTCNPDVLVVDLKRGDEFLILACDGIWDVVSNEQAVAFVRAELRIEPILSRVASRLLDHCLADDSTGSALGTDNMTCLVIQLKEELFASD